MFVGVYTAPCAQMSIFAAQASSKDWVRRPRIKPGKRATVTRTEIVISVACCLYFLHDRIAALGSEGLPPGDDIKTLVFKTL